MLLFIYSPFPGCGKTTAAQYLCERHQFCRVSFASAIRKVAAELLRTLSYSEEDIEYYLTIGKDDQMSGISVTGRYLMQKLGTDFARNMIHDQIWLMAFSAFCGELREAVQYNVKDLRLVCDDLRFFNEFQYAQNAGGVTIWLNRRSAVPKKPVAPLFLQNLVWNIPLLRKLLLHFFTLNHPSNNALKGREWEFDYVIPNDSTKVELFRTLDMLMLIEELQ